MSGIWNLADDIANAGRPVEDFVRMVLEATLPHDLIELIGFVDLFVGRVYPWQIFLSDNGIINALLGSSLVMRINSWLRNRAKVWALSLDTEADWGCAFRRSLVR